LLKSHALPADFSELPAVVFLNHAAWWDPLICLLLTSKFFPGRSSFAPIDARALKRYRFLSKLGFFPVEMGSSRGAAGFLHKAETILESNERMLWVTPQGKFTDPRERPISFQRGLAHLAGRVPPAVFQPLAIEYTFWEERTPEVLLAFGTPLFTQQHQNSCGADDWAGALERTLEDTQDALAQAAQRRQADEWETLLRGAAGTTPFYDAWRRVRASMRRERFQQEHSAL
jgi:1-acyl-sn-glycerol-3-phosphate acyltransferase